ncbi:MAG: transposase [Flavobacteriaceae bacterium]|nr:transposase [Flavobacteriaceae bacterium]
MGYLKSIVKVKKYVINHLILITQDKKSNDCFEIKGNIYAFDSSIIDLCLSVFWWTHFRKTKAGIKLYTLFDINTQISVFIHITKAIIYDVNAMDIINYERFAYYIFDRAYVVYERFYRITKAAAYFVVKAKSNVKFKRIYSKKMINPQELYMIKNKKSMSFIYQKIILKRYEELSFSIKKIKKRYFF